MVLLTALHAGARSGCSTVGIPGSMECCEISSLEAAGAEQEPEAHPVSGLPSDAQPHSVWSTQSLPVCLRCGCRQREGRAFQEQSRASSASAHHITFSCPSHLSVGEGELNREDVYSPKFKSGKKGGNIKICSSSIRAVLGHVRAAQSSCVMQQTHRGASCFPWNTYTGDENTIIFHSCSSTASPVHSSRQTRFVFTITHTDVGLMEQEPTCVARN